MDRWFGIVRWGETWIESIGVIKLGCVETRGGLSSGDEESDESEEDELME